MANLPLDVDRRLRKLLYEMGETVGSEYRITFIARNTERKNADIILGDDMKSMAVTAVLKYLQVDQVDQL